MWSVWKVISFYQPKWTCASAEFIILFNPFDFVSMAFMVRESALKFELSPKHGGGKTRLAPEKRPKGCGHKHGPERQPFQPSVSNVVWNETHQADVTSWAIDIRNEGIEKGKRANQLATTSFWLWSSYHLSRQRLDHKTTITSDVEETLHIAHKTKSTQMPRYINSNARKKKCAIQIFGIWQALWNRMPWRTCVVITH